MSTRVFTLVLKNMVYLAGPRSMSLQWMSIMSQMQNQALTPASLTSSISKSTMMLQQEPIQSMHQSQLHL